MYINPDHIEILAEGYVRLSLDNATIAASLWQQHDEICMDSDRLTGPRYIYITKRFNPASSSIYYMLTKVRYKPKCFNINHKEFIGLALLPKEAKIIYLDSLLHEIKPMPTTP